MRGYCRVDLSGQRPSTPCLWCCCFFWARPRDCRGLKWAKVGVIKIITCEEQHLEILEECALPKNIPPGNSGNLSPFPSVCQRIRFGFDHSYAEAASSGQSVDWSCCCGMRRKPRDKHVLGRGGAVALDHLVPVSYVHLLGAHRGVLSGAPSLAPCCMLCLSGEIPLSLICFSPLSHR